MSNCVNRIELLGPKQSWGKVRDRRLQRKHAQERRACGQAAGPPELIKIYISSSLCLLAINKTNHQLAFNYKVFIPLLNRN